MRKSFIVFFLLSLTSTFSCDDGDIIDVEFDFDDTFEACGVVDLVFYKTKEDPSETLSILIKNYTLEDILNVGDDNIFEVIKTGSTFYYRTYSNESLPNDLFCSAIPPSDINIIEDYESSCSAEIRTVLTEDDDDDILAKLEDLDNNDNLEDDDTDGDGIPNYLDEDDDGDNVPTKNENPDPNGDGNLDDAQDTDGDTIPDYLDDDDDGDGVLTRDEETNEQNENPADDVTNSDIGPNYLNPDVAVEVPATAYRTHNIKQTYVVTLNAIGVTIDILQQDNFNFGILKESEIHSDFKSREVTPEFN